MVNLKKSFLIICLIISNIVSIHASVADTISVITHDWEVIVTDPSRGANPYPRWGAFPGKDVPIRKITMYIHFACPDTLRCADWDYADPIMIGRTGGINGENLNWEIGRLITPYGGFYGSNWQFSWEADVTDFSLVLRDSVEIIFIHTGYEPNHDRGWKVSVEFEIIPGTPSSTPISVTEIYNDRFPYGDKENPIEEKLLPVRFTAAENASFARLSVIQTGHGMDPPDNCAEFCNKYREFRFDGELLQKRQMWMECGLNPVYPQAGTWIFDRANWCPGYLVQPEIFDLSVRPNDSHTIHFIMEPFTATEYNYSAQIISAYLIQYEKPAFSNDVSVADIIVPSNKDIHSRKNPSGANAQILVKNSGSDEIVSMTIHYGTKGFPQNTYRWRGSLAFNESETIMLPGIIDGRAGENIFNVSISEPNEKPDEYPADNILTATFHPVPVHDSTLIFYLHTNNQPEHNAWQLVDSKGVNIKERESGSLSAQSAYRDTFRLEPGAYSLTLIDTAGDGLEFWFNEKGGRGEALLMDGNNNLIKAFESDCGSGWTYNFVVDRDYDKPDPYNRAISIYPARTSDFTELSFFFNTPEDVVVRLVHDPGGDIAEEHRYIQLKEGVFTYDLRRFPYGRFYVKVIVDEKEIFNKRVRYVEPAPEEGEPPYIPLADPEVMEKLNQWQDWKFGVIIHWGPYSQWGVVESWSLCPEDEPWCIRRGPYADDYYMYVKEYEKIREVFNPVKFDPEKWAKACIDAGMKYLVFTTKHHDGFCMFDSKYTDYTITDPGSIFSQNPRSNITEEVFDAFRERGMGIGVYFSKPDWHSNDYWWRYPPVFDRNVNYDPEKYTERWQRFREFTYNQIEELMTEYGTVDILWLDGGWVRPGGTLTEETKPWLGKNQWVQDVNMPTIAAMAREHQPGLLIVDRTVHGEFENYRTPEQHVPETIPGYPWESCITLGDGWYSADPDEQYKPATWVIHTLIKIVAKGGNFLLGIGPDKTGELVPEVYNRLAEVGAWMDVNSSAIYNSKPLAPHQSGKYCYTQSKDEKTKYLFYLIDETEKLPVEVEIPAEFNGSIGKVTLLGITDQLNIQMRRGLQYVTIPEEYLKLYGNTPALVFRVTEGE